MLTNLDTLTRLQISHSYQDIAAAFDLDSRKFFYVSQNTETGEYYQRFEIPKKSGGGRVISRPVRGLALSQDRIAVFLNNHYRKRPFVKGYVKGESFLTNAQYHENQRWILNVDISNFFPTISFGRVRGLFMSSVFSFSPRVSTILARICTYQNELPQGASTSPVLANFIAHNLDKRLVQIARTHRIKYSRYADDITFSSDHRRIPTQLVEDYSKKWNDGKIQLGNHLVSEFERSGFKLNDKKSRLLLRSDRQEVTGLIVNQKANLWRKDISRLRMKLHSSRKFGLESAAKVWLGEKYTAGSMKSHLIGWLSFVRQVRGGNDPVLAKLCKMAVEATITDIEWIKETSELVREFDVFLSHASEDKPQIRKLKDEMERVGIRVFFDEDSISWGDSIVEKINFGLLRSTFFMPFLTSTFFNKGWTNKELNSAISNSASQKSRILPIKGSGFELDVKYPLLNDTLYKTWPGEEVEEKEFVIGLSDEVLKLIELEKHKKL